MNSRKPDSQKLHSLISFTTSFAVGITLFYWIHNMINLESWQKVGLFFVIGIPLQKLINWVNEI